MQSVMYGQIKIKVEPSLNVGASIGIVYAPEVFNYDKTEI